MSTDTADAPVATDVHDEHHGPSDKLFIRTALVLAAITAAEVVWHYLPFWEGADSTWMTILQVGGLMVMMAWKFVIVAGTFMHLKFDHKLLTAVFYAGLVLAVSVYVVALFTFEVFSSGTAGFTP